MDWQAWVTLGVIVVMIVAMAREILPPSLTVLSATVALLLFGIIDAEQAFSGFSNEAPIIVGALLVFARAVDISGLLTTAVQRIFAAEARLTGMLARLVFPVAAASGFLNNTTLVAMTVPAVLDLCQRRGISPSHFLIPISYAAILGGVMTAIGTSTNLTVSGLLVESQMPALGLFELLPVGLPIALVGSATIVLLAPRLLPERGSSRQSVAGRDFTVSMRVVPAGPVDGRSVEEAGLRRLQGVFLFQVDRTGRTLAPVAPDEVLVAGDVLTFAGRVDHVVDLQRMPGLEWAESKHIDALGDGRAFYEAVVGPDLGSGGDTLRSIGFRSRFGAAVLAIHRADQRVDAKLGEVPLRLGDTLLLLADPGFRERHRDGRDFLLVAPISGVVPQRPHKAGWVALGGLAFVVLTAIGLIPILEASLGLVAYLLVTRALNVRQARDAIDLHIVVLIAAAFGLGAAVQHTGLAAAVAQLLVAIFTPFGSIGALAGVMLATIVLTELVSHNGAAVLMFPIAVASAAVIGADPRPFVIGVTLGASLSFLTPLGYQTNLMVFGLGGYRFGDFSRLGVPLNVVTVTLSLAIIPAVFPL